MTIKAQISSPHFPLTEALVQAVNEKVSRLNDHGVEGHIVNVVLDKGGPGRHKVKAHIQGASSSISATVSDKDMYSAIDRVVSLLSRQWRKRKTAHLSRRNKGETIRRPKF